MVAAFPQSRMRPLGSGVLGLGVGFAAVIELVELVEQLDRLGAQRRIDRDVVLVGELAGLVIELGVADLSVFGVPRGLQIDLLQRLELVLLKLSSRAAPERRR